jgi:hypothetical protein
MEEKLSVSRLFCRSLLQDFDQTCNACGDGGEYHLKCLGQPAIMGAK